MGHDGRSLAPLMHRQTMHGMGGAPERSHGKQPLVDLPLPAGSP